MTKLTKTTKSEMIHAIKATKSIRAAAKYTDTPYGTFISRAKKFGIYNTNQSGKGIAKNRDAYRIPTSEILSGKHPQYSSSTLKIRLMREGVLENKCNVCGCVEWLGEPITMEMDHINGTNDDHRLDNLQMLCPNCHSQTDSFRGRNKSGKKNKRTNCSDTEALDALSKTDNIHEALMLLGLKPMGANYKKMQRLQQITDHLAR